jgi:hypothetical protein
MEYEEDYGEEYEESAEPETIVGDDGTVFEVVDEDDETGERIAAIENHLMAQAQAEQEGYYEEPEGYEEYEESEAIPDPNNPGYAFDLDAIASRFLAAEIEAGRELTGPEVEQLLDHVLSTGEDPANLIEYVDHSDDRQRRDWMAAKMKEGLD